MGAAAVVKGNRSMNVRAWIASLTGATLVAALSVVTVAVPAADAAPPVQVPVGTLTLSTGAVDNLVYDKGTASTADDVTQAIGTKAGTNCTLEPTTGPLATWTATGGVPSFRSDSIGTSATTLPILACAQINKSFSQSLTLSLDRSVDGPYGSIFGVAFANAASLDVEVKGDDALIRADVSLNGTTTGTFYLFNDAKTSKRPVLTNLTVCDGDQSSYYTSTDRGTKDNCTWPISGVSFDRIKLTPQKGSVSLEGGGDWGTEAAAHRSTISLVALADGTVDCDASTGEVVNEGSVSGATVTRLANGDPLEPCASLPFTLTTEGGSVTFLKPGDTQGSAQFTLALTRNVPASTGVEALLVDWEDGTAEYDLPWCQPPFLGSGGSFNYANLTSGDDASSITSGIKYACQYDIDVTLEDDGSLTISDSVYFTGDIKFTTR